MFRLGCRWGVVRKCCGTSYIRKKLVYLHLNDVPGFHFPRRSTVDQSRNRQDVRRDSARAAADPELGLAPGAIHPRRPPPKESLKSSGDGQRLRGFDQSRVFRLHFVARPGSKEDKTALHSPRQRSRGHKSVGSRWEFFFHISSEIYPLSLSLTFPTSKVPRT